MKEVFYDRKFLKAYAALIKNNKKLAVKIAERIRLFQQGKDARVLKDHKLSGEMVGQRAFSISGDIRIIYQESEEGYFFLNIGTHNQVYK